MKKTVIDIEGLSKRYRLGQIGTHTLKGDLQQWWYKFRGQEDQLVAVDKQYSDEYNWALNDINLRVNEGDVLGVIGRNGAGKSSLLKVLSRVTTPTAGCVKIKGRIASLLEVGTGFHMELSGRENIMLNGAILGMSRHEIRAKMDEIVSFADIEKYLDTPVKRYSSGMFVRLAFAVAAHLEPEILIVDEVLAVGDAEFQRKAIGKMKDVSERSGRTVLFVSHNMTLIRKLCTRAVVIDSGKIVKDGSTPDAINYYLESLPKTFDLNAKNRKGNGKLRLSDFKAYSNPANFSGSPQLGLPLYLEFSFTGVADFMKDEVVVDFRIDNEWGDRVLWLSTSLIEHQVRGGVVTFIQENCPLNEGKYYITLHCAVGKETADWVENVATFMVHEGDYYRTGQKVPRMQSNLWVDFKVQS